MRPSYSPSNSKWPAPRSSEGAGHPIGCGSTCETTNITSQRSAEATPQRPDIDREKVDAFFAAFPSSLLLPAGALEAVAWRVFAEPGELPRLVWLDMQTGREGDGAVSLAALVFGVSEAEAAYRLAKCAFLSGAPNGKLVSFAYYVMRGKAQP